jgi:hypothetical protein
LTKTVQIAIYRPQFWACRLAVPVAGKGNRGRVVRFVPGADEIGMMIPALLMAG